MSGLILLISERTLRPDFRIHRVLNHVGADTTRGPPRKGSSREDPLDLPVFLVRKFLAHDVIDVYCVVIHVIEQREF
jgi:hypothetical protein